MIKVKCIRNFTLNDYEKLKYVEKVAIRKENEFDKNDCFECDEYMADYLTGNNPLKLKVVEVVEIIPNEKNSRKKLKK